MKKFTTLEEDMIKENVQVEQKFNTHLLNAQNKLNQIKTELDNFESQYKSDKGNWGYVGSIAHVNELLDEIVEFLHPQSTNSITDTVYNSDPGHEREMEEWKKDKKGIWSEDK